MAAVQSEDTGPEMAVRKIVHGLGYRYRLHVRTLPGRPDLVFPARRKVIFVHGCFWHRHSSCKFCYTPKSRTEFWSAKFKGTIERDKLAEGALRSLGWHVTLVWECELDDEDKLARKLGEAIQRTA